MSTIYKTFAVETKAVDAEAGIYRARISTEDVDRDGDIMLAAGAQMENYLKNPVVLFGHNYREARAVVGKATEVTAIPGVGIDATFQFAGKDVSEDADLVRRLWAGGFLNATSIGFIPKKWEPRETPEGEKLREGRKFTEWELLEFSVVPVPANQNALRLALKAFGEDDTEYNAADNLPDVEGAGSASDAGVPGDPEQNGAEEPDTNDPSHDASEDVPEPVLDQLLNFVETLTEVFNHERAN